MLEFWLSGDLRALFDAAGPAISSERRALYQLSRFRPAYPPAVSQDDDVAHLSQSVSDLWWRAEGMRTSGTQFVIRRVESLKIDFASQSIIATMTSEPGPHDFAGVIGDLAGGGSLARALLEAQPRRLRVYRVDPSRWLPMEPPAMDALDEPMTRSAYLSYPRGARRSLGWRPTNEYDQTPLIRLFDALASRIEEDRRRPGQSG